MGKVSDRIVELIERQVADRGIVVWYDPEKVYENLAKSLKVDDATVVLGGQWILPPPRTIGKNEVGYAAMSSYSRACNGGG